MPEKEFTFRISKTVQCVIRFITEKGKVVGFVVRLRAMIDGQWREIRRYDTAHGMPHIDVLNWRGRLIEKIWLPHSSVSKALTFAQEDIKLNYKIYIKRFLK